MSLYFNVSYSPFWILSLAVGLEAKVSRQQKFSLHTAFKHAYRVRAGLVISMIAIHFE